MTPTSENSPGGLRGFTLLELLVVLVIVAIVSVLVVPNLVTLDNSAFNAQVRKATAALNYARRVAIVQGAPREVVFTSLNPDSPDYEKKQAALDSNNAAANWTSDTLSLDYQSDLNQSADPVDTVAVTFYPQGGSTGGVLGFSQLQRHAMIRIDPITGRIATALNGEELGDAH